MIATGAARRAPGSDPARKEPECVRGVLEPTPGLPLPAMPRPHSAGDRRFPASDRAHSEKAVPGLHSSALPRRRIAYATAADHRSGGKALRVARTRAIARLTGQRSRGCRLAPFALECIQRGARPPGSGSLTCRGSVAACAVTHSAFAGSDRCLVGSGRGKIDTRAPSLGQSNRNGLLGRSGAVHSLADVVHLFLDELTCLSRCGLALAFIGASPRQCLLFRHRAPQRLLSLGSALTKMMTSGLAHQMQVSKIRPFHDEGLR